MATFQCTYQWTRRFLRGREGATLDAIIDMNHALAKLARTIDWSFLKERFGAVYEDKPDRPPLPTRLMAGLAILKHTYDLSEIRCLRPPASRSTLAAA
jgi:hypothetical protein